MRRPLPPSRSRRIAKWAGLVVCNVIVVMLLLVGFIGRWLGDGDRVAIVVPFWLLFTLAAFPTAVLWHRDRRTVKPGCCLTCGYDLRASKKVCPECGMPIIEESR